MIVEAIELLLTLCPKRWRRLGYAYAAVACSARARRRAGAWRPHQERTQTAIRAAIAACNQRRTALILGSGPLLDLPLPDLVAAFDRVILVDVAHPPAARLAAWQESKIQLVQLDVTGTADSLSDASLSSLPVPGCAAFLDRTDIDLVVSCNLASQLPLVPLSVLERRWPDLDAEAYGQAIVAAHIDYLQRFQGVVLIIADVVRAIFDRSGALLSQEDPLFGVALPEGDEWEWDLAPPGELRGGQSVMTRVRAARLDQAQNFH